MAATSAIIAGLGTAIGAAGTAYNMLGSNSSSANTGAYEWARDQSLQTAASLQDAGDYALTNWGYLQDEYPALIESATNRESQRLDWANQLLSPYAGAGETATNTLMSKLSAGPGEFTTSPGYTARLGTGLKSTTNYLASMGLRDSGAALKALTNYGQEYASNEYQNFLTNYYNSLTPYQTIADRGATAANSMSNYAVSSGSQLNSLIASLQGQKVTGSQNAVNQYINALSASGGNTSTAGSYSTKTSEAQTLSDALNSSSFSSSMNNALLLPYLYKSLSGLNTGTSSTGSSTSTDYASQIADWQNILATSGSTLSSYP